MSTSSPYEADEENRDSDTLTDMEKERRRYFRIEEEVILFFREVVPDEIPDCTGLQEIPFDPFALSSTLDLLTQESRTLLRRIERDAPDIAEFLRLMERKIDLIGRAFMTCEGELGERPTQRVNLSASGLSFESEAAYPPGKVLELKMVLMPNMVGLIAYGRVVYCRKSPSPLPYRVAVDFVGLCDRDRELLIRHVVRRQLQQLRSKKHPPA